MGVWGGWDALLLVSIAWTKCLGPYMQPLRVKTTSKLPARLDFYAHIAHERGLLHMHTGRHISLLLLVGVAFRAGVLRRSA